VFSYPVSSEMKLPRTASTCITVKPFFGFCSGQSWPEPIMERDSGQSETLEGIKRSSVSPGKVTFGERLPSLSLPNQIDLRRMQITNHR
jgi:hypothetical protein